MGGVTIKYVKHEPKEIVMGKKPVADYYPPGATEPQVRPDSVPAPEPVPAPVEVQGVITGDKEEAPKVSAKKPAKKR